VNQFLSKIVPNEATSPNAGYDRLKNLSIFDCHPHLSLSGARHVREVIGEFFFGADPPRGRPSGGGGHHMK